MMAQHQPNHTGGNPNYWCLYLKVFPCLAGESYYIYKLYIVFVAQPAFLSILAMSPSSINFCGSYASQNWVMGKKTVGTQFFEDQQHALRVDVPSKPNPLNPSVPL